MNGWLAAGMLLAMAPAFVQADECAALLYEANRAGEFRASDSTAGIAAARAGLAHDEIDRCPEAHAEMHAALADNLGVAGRTDESIAAYEQARALLEPLGDTADLASMLRREAITHASAGDYTTAVERTLESYRISDALGDAGDAAMAAGNLGSLYSRLHDFERARHHFERAHEGFVATGNRVSAAGTDINLGSLLMRQADRLVADGDADGARALREQALEHNRAALESFEALDHPRGISMAASNAGVAHNLMGNHEAAIRFHRRAHALRERVGDRDGLVASHIHLAQSQIPLGWYDDAEAHLRQAEELAADRSFMLRAGVVEKWIELEEARGDLPQALARMRELNRLRQESADADHQARVAEIQARYDSAEQAREIEALRFQGEIADLVLERQRAWLVTGTIIVALLVLVLAATLLWHRVRQRHVRDMEQVARTDDLTELMNRRGARDRIAYEVRRSRRSGRPFALCLIDIDGFKAVNDRYGHEGGDRVLIGAVEVLQRSMRNQDTLARWGGDELLVLLPETDEAGAVTVAGKLSSALAAAPLSVDGETVALTMSVGVAQYWPGQGVDETVRAADDAMYRGKKAGRGRVVSSRER